MKAELPLITVAALLNVAVLSSAQEIVDDWRYTLRRPAEAWRQPDFDAATWKQGPGGFGTRNTPEARVGTVWATNDIWLRKSFQLDSIPGNPALLIHHDEDAEVYINGQGVAVLKGFTREYGVVPIEKRSALKNGQNVLAVHCRQTTGGQFIDVHLVDADSVPKLPPPKRCTKPFQSELMTPWGEAVTPENAWTEYPRPQLARDTWHNLNGHWDYAITAADDHKKPEEWSGRILVPYCLESKLGGVQRLLDATEALWYRRTFEASPASGLHTLLNFEAVDYRCDVFVNGQSVGSHQGGNTPFSLDITGVVRHGENEVVVRVEDETEAWQLRGKQVLNARGIWYTQVSGIWQTVWLEHVAPCHIRDLKIATDPSAGTITVRPLLAEQSGSEVVRIVVKDGDRPVAESEGAMRSFTLTIPDAKLWSPDSPQLYDIQVTLLDAGGQVLDSVASYAGIRAVGKKQDAGGHWRFTLNGKEIFHWGPLDQGWWPDGLLTPPSDEGMLFDIQYLKAAGFNMIRKHIKVEPRRYYYHCDRLGMMVWQDHVSGGEQPPWTRLKPNPVDARWPDEQHRQFMLELDRMISALENHPSIVSWVPFNERWGQHRTMEVGRWTVQRDPTRLVNIASGGNFWPVGDVVDAHKYPHPEFPFADGAGGRFDDYIKVMGEFGGHGYPVPGHLWDANRRNWGYGGLPQNEEEYKQRYVTSLDMLNELRALGIAGGIYTQTTDVEGEINGLVTYDRKIVKIPAAELAELHQRLFADPPAVDTSLRESHPPAAERGHVDAETIRAGLKSHDRALYIKSGWIRDPYIILGPDDCYYLTGTQPNPGDPREAADPHNIGLGEQSIVGEYVRLWRSKDLIEWQYLGEPFGLQDTFHASTRGKQPRKRLLWAPEVHWLGDRWALVHCPGAVSSLALSSGPQLEGPWQHPMGEGLGRRHDPSLFQDQDGTWYLLWGNTLIAPLSDDFSNYTAEPVRIDPAGSRPGPDGQPIDRIGHEGATMRKIGDKYVHFGTAWSTDMGRKGSYNLYYCTADRITGPYGPRRFAGRFLGHGTPFQDREGRWWCTAFFNANIPPLSRKGIETRDLSEDAQTINKQGVTIVPLEVRILDDGDVYIRAKDPAYATPGPDEVQDFSS
jgi:beta-galactosidase/beta-glucuronidase